MELDLADDVFDLFIIGTRPADVILEMMCYKIAEHLCITINIDGTTSRGLEIVFMHLIRIWHTRKELILEITPWNLAKLGYVPNYIMHPTKVLRQALKRQREYSRAKKVEQQTDLGLNILDTFAAGMEILGPKIGVNLEGYQDAMRAELHKQRKLMGEIMTNYSDNRSPTAKLLRLMAETMARVAHDKYVAHADLPGVKANPTTDHIIDTFN